MTIADNPHQQINPGHASSAPLTPLPNIVDVVIIIIAQICSLAFPFQTHAVGEQADLMCKPNWDYSVPCTNGQDKEVDGKEVIGGQGCFCDDATDGITTPGTCAGAGDCKATNPKGTPPEQQSATPQTPEVSPDQPPTSPSETPQSTPPDQQLTFGEPESTPNGPSPSSPFPPDTLSLENPYPPSPFSPDTLSSYNPYLAAPPSSVVPSNDSPIFNETTGQWEFPTLSSFSESKRQYGDVSASTTD